MHKMYTFRWFSFAFWSTIANSILSYHRYREEIPSAKRNKRRKIGWKGAKIFRGKSNQRCRISSVTKNFPREIVLILLIPLPPTCSLSHAGSSVIVFSIYRFTTNLVLTISMFYKNGLDSFFFFLNINWKI